MRVCVCVTACTRRCVCACVTACTRRCVYECVRASLRVRVGVCMRVCVRVRVDVYVRTCWGKTLKVNLITKSFESFYIGRQLFQDLINILLVTTSDDSCFRT